MLFINIISNYNYEVVKFDCGGEFCILHVRELSEMANVSVDQFYLDTHTIIKVKRLY